MELLIPNRILNDDTYKLYIAYATETKNLSVLRCDGSIRFCDSNPEGKLLRCKLCQHRVSKITKITGKSTEFSMKNMKKQPVSSNFQHSFKNSAMGLLASHEAVSLENRISKKAVRYKDKLIESSETLFFFLKHICAESTNISRLVVFNGRYPLALASYFAAREANVEFRAMELWGRKVPHFTDNRLIHDPQHVFDSCNLSYQEANVQDHVRIAAAYFEGRFKWGGGASGEKNFTSSQKRTSANVFQSNGKTIKLALFPSSNFEYNFLPEGYTPLNQAVEIKNLICRLSKLEITAELVVRLHPNLKNSPPIEIKEFLDLSLLSNKFLNVRIVAPGDTMSTYQMMNEANYVVSFASFAAVEANYLGKKVLQIGSSRYRHFNIANHYENGFEAAEALLNGSSESKPNLGAIIFGLGFMVPNKKHLNIWTSYGKVKIRPLEKLFSGILLFLTRYHS